MLCHPTREQEDLEGPEDLGGRARQQRNPLPGDPEAGRLPLPYFRALFSSWCQRWVAFTGTGAQSPPPPSGLAALSERS